jgi:pantoate ligase/cytidylate kinase
VPPIETLEAQIRERDHLDSTRSAAPLRKAVDAVEVATDDRSIDESAAYLLELYRQRLGVG